MHPGWRKNYLRYKSYFLNVAGQYRERADIKVYLEILLSLSTVTVFSIFALRPTLLTIAELIKEIETKNETIIIIDSKIQNLSRAQQLNDQQRRNISFLRVAIPQDPSPDVFARQIEALSIEHQIPVTNITLGEALILGKEASNTGSGQPSPETPKLESEAQELKFSVQTKTDITNFTLTSNFLGNMERLRRPIKIGSFNFNSAEDKDKTQKNLIFTITGTLPYIEISE